MGPGTRDGRRPRLALPFTVLASPGTVRLVAGEDYRYTLEGVELDLWLPPLLAGFDGRRTLGQSLAALDETRRAPAERLIDRLYGERVLVDGVAADAHEPAAFRIVAEGDGPLREGFSAAPGAGPELAVLCQDRLDYDAALKFNRRRLDAGTPWMWATIGPMGRGYVSPVFLPASGPCLGCLLRHFKRRSPAPELYEALEEQGRSGRPIAPATFPAEGIGTLRELIGWKASLLAQPAPPAALYRLHVLEASSFEVSTHRVFLDPECEACEGRRR